MWCPKQEKVRKPGVLCLYCWIFSMWVCIYNFYMYYPHVENPTIQTQDSWLSHLLLLWTNTYIYIYIYIYIYRDIEREREREREMFY